jgi:hypothetical protein
VRSAEIAVRCGTMPWMRIRPGIRARRPDAAVDAGTVGVAALISDDSLRWPARDSKDQVQNALDGCFRRLEYGNLPSTRHYQHAIGMLDDLLKVRRNEDHAHPLITEARMA